MTKAKYTNGRSNSLRITQFEQEETYERTLKYIIPKKDVEQISFTENIDGLAYPVINDDEFSNYNFIHRFVTFLGSNHYRTLKSLQAQGRKNIIVAVTFVDEWLSSPVTQEMEEFLERIKFKEQQQEIMKNGIFDDQRLKLDVIKEENDPSLREEPKPEVEEEVKLNLTLFVIILHDQEPYQIPDGSFLGNSSESEPLISHNFSRKERYSIVYQYSSSELGKNLQKEGSALKWLEEVSQAQNSPISVIDTCNNPDQNFIQRILEV